MNWGGGYQKSINNRDKSSLVVKILVLGYGGRRGGSNRECEVSLLELQD